MKFLKQKNHKLLLLYFITHFSYGILFNVLGPILPFLAQKKQVNQSAFVYLVTIRGVGYLLAGFLNKTILKDYENHLKLCISAFIAGLGFIFTSIFIDYIILGAIMVFTSIGSCLIQTLINVCILIEGKKDVKFWVTTLYGVYGIGAIVGPILISFFGLFGYTLIGFWFILIGFLFLFNLNNKEEDKEDLKQQLSVQKSKENSKQNKQYQIILPKKNLNNLMQNCMAFMFLAYAAFTLSLRGLLPSYAVMDHITNSSMASLSISIYSLFLTFFRFFFIFVKIDLIKMLHFQHNIVLGTVLVSIVLHYMGYGVIVVFGSSIALGMAFSSYFPLMLSLPSHYNFQVTSSNSSTFMIGYSIGQAAISGLIGYLMGLTQPIFLFYSLLFLGISMKIIFGYVLENLSKNQEVKDDNIIENYRKSIISDISSSKY